MTEAQIQLQNALTTTFLENLEFLREYDNTLYRRVELLSQMIEEGIYQPKYELEFIKESGDFDIYDNQTKTYLYNRTPKKINETLVKEIKKDGRKAIFNIEEYFGIRTNKQDTGDEDYLAIAHNMTIEYSRLLNDYVDTHKDKKYKNIVKFTFIGIFLGRHIPQIVEKIDPKLCLIIENNLEIFRLSLFTISYKNLAMNRILIFSIMQDIIELEVKIEEFLNKSRLENYLIKFSMLGEKAKDNYNVLVSQAIMRKPSVYNFARFLYSYVNKTTKRINEDYKFLLFNKIRNELNIFEDIPVLLVAAGPSLDTNLDWIKQNQNKFFIVSIASIYNKLLNSGIKVDLVTTLDEQKIIKELQFPDDLIQKIESNTTFFASAFTTSQILEDLKDKNLFIFESYSPFFKDNLFFGGFSIGELSLDIILHLNAKNIYLVGLDLSLNQETGDTHSKGAGSGVSKIDLTKKEIGYTDVSIVNVKGNLLEKVKTTRKLYGSVKELEKQILKKDKDINIYNLSQNGAFFEGTIPLDIETLDINSFKNIDKELLNFKSILENFSQVYLNEVEKEVHKEDIKFLETIIKDMLNHIKNYNFKNYDEFNEYIVNIMDKIVEKKLNILYRVLLNYYETLIPYLNYHFNDIRLIQEYQKVQKVKLIFVFQVEKLIDDYILFIKRVI